MPRPLVNLKQLLEELDLTASSSTAPPINLDDLYLEEAAHLLLHEGRPALLLKLRESGLNAGHAGKVANALSKAIREGRVPGVEMPKKPPQEPPRKGPVEYIPNENLTPTNAAPSELPPSNNNITTRAGAVAAALEAAACEDVQPLKLEPTDANAASADGTTALMLAASDGDLECVKLLLDSGADISAARADGSTALTEAIQRGHKACVDLLLERKASPTATLHHGWTPLHVAGLHTDDETIVWALLDAMVHEADMQDALEVKDADGATPFMIAAQHGHCKCMAQLMPFKEEAFHAQRSDGLTALASAAAGGHHACLALLLINGADEPLKSIETPCNAGWSPLLYACYNGHYECVDILLAEGADANRPRKESGFTPLMAAAAAGHARCIKRLLNAGADGSTAKAHVKRGEEWFARTAEDYARLGEAPDECLAALGIEQPPTAEPEATEGNGAAAVDVSDNSHNGDAADEGFLTFQYPSSLQPEEVWQERPVRSLHPTPTNTEKVEAKQEAAAESSELEELQAKFEALVKANKELQLKIANAGTEEPSQEASPIASLSKDSSSLYFKSNTGLHGCNIVQLILRDHGFRRSPPLLKPRLKRHVRRSWFARGAADTEDDVDDGAWSVEWRSGRIEGHEVHALQPWQKVNKFPGISCLTLKSELYKHYLRMRERHGAQHYGYMPLTFVLPEEHDAWQAARLADAKTTPVWIVKPNNSSRGRGITLVHAREAEEEDEEDGGGASESGYESMQGVACAYVHAPLLLDGKKFDLRLFVLITSWNPLCVYLYDGGLARFAESKYSLLISSETQVGRTHLTNHSFNEFGRRMMLDTLYERICDERGVEFADSMWKAIDDLVVKMALSVEGTMTKSLNNSSLRAACGHPNTQCFELLGIDVMFGVDGTPWLLEANLDPSLSTEDCIGTPKGANAKLKCGMLVDLFNLVGIKKPQPPEATQPPPASDAAAKAAAAAAAEAEYKKAQASRRLTSPEVQFGTVQHINAEFERSKGGRWRRLLPSSRSAEYEQFIGGERLVRNKYPFAFQ